MPRKARIDDLDGQFTGTGRQRRAVETCGYLARVNVLVPPLLAPGVYCCAFGMRDFGGGLSVFSFVRILDT
jgi:hypothetical protein